MGQYYIAIILGENQENKKEIIRFYMESFVSSGAKLTEHSYIGNPFVSTFEHFLTPEGMFYKSRVVWAGDYADNEEGINTNLHSIVNEYPNKSFHVITNQEVKSTEDYRYIINHTKKEYVDKTKSNYHPLPLLTCEGNGRGGGDYYGSGIDKIGFWARDVISSEKGKPDDYKELIINFT
jgi:hypothetical protein